MELRCKYNLVINHKKVLRIMKENDVLCVTKKKAKYKSYHGEVGKIAVNKLERNFTSNKPFKKICTDVTEFKVGEKRQYLSCAIDLYSRKIIGYSLSSSPTVDFVMDSIKPFIEDASNSIIHSDQGFQYQNKKYHRLLEKHNSSLSMSRKGNCLDNSPIENFFSILKNEMYHRTDFEDTNHLRNEIINYIQYYNTERISLKLKGMTPSEYLKSFQY